MRFFGIALTFSAVVFGQLAPPPQQAKVPDETVVATIDGKKYTAGELRAMIVGLPPQGQQQWQIDPASVLQTVLVMKYLASEAEKLDLDKQSPVKEQLELIRNQFLTQVEWTNYRAKIAVIPEDQKKYYQEHAADFQQAKVRVIYIAFSSGQVKSDKKLLTEAEAKAKIEDLRKKLLAGADFATVAKENSEDKESAEKGGEWGVVKRTSNSPGRRQKSRSSRLKPGDISEPVRQANGYLPTQSGRVHVTALRGSGYTNFRQNPPAAFRRLDEGNSEDASRVKWRTKISFRTEPAPPASR